MPKQELVDYLKDGINKGYPMEQLRQALLNNNCSPKDVDEAVNSLATPSKAGPAKTDRIKGAVIGYIALAFIVFTGIAAVRAFIPNFVPGPAPYALIAIVTLLIGWLSFRSIDKRTDNGSKIAFSAMCIPLFGLFILQGFLIIVERLGEQLAALSVATGGVGILNIFSSDTAPLLTSIIVYASFIVPFLIGIVVRKKYKSLAWFLIAPLFFGLVYFLVNFIVRTFTTAYIV
ncbi:hypothetical protein KY360_01480 [Candidatus Woesearchaeota archaeon]|nr:hypothetical protein [Candidatus Woesearchaeota archaeon]